MRYLNCIVYLVRSDVSFISQNILQQEMFFEPEVIVDPFHMHPWCSLKTVNSGCGVDITL